MGCPMQNCVFTSFRESKTSERKREDRRVLRVFQALCLFFNLIFEKAIFHWSLLFKVILMIKPIKHL